MSRIGLLLLCSLFSIATSSEAQSGGDRIQSPSVNGYIFVDGDKYPSLNSAIAAACNGSTPGVVVVPPGTFTGPFTPVSYCTIEGSGMGSTIIQASATQATTMISISSLTNVALKHFTVDGGAVRLRGSPDSGNTNSYDLIDISSSSNITLDDVEVRNAVGSAVNVLAGNSHIDIRNSVAQRVGPLLTGTAGAFAVNPGSGSGNVDVSFFNNAAHDCNIGFYLTSSSTSSASTYGVVFDKNRAYSCANDGLVAYTAGVNSYATIYGAIWTNNVSYCNGWPASGTNWNSTLCPPGLLQVGSSASSSGVGVNLNSPILEQPMAIGNTAWGNYFEGLDVTPQVTSTVNCTNVANSVCSRSSGDFFITSWKPNQALRINGTDYLILSVGSITSVTLTSNTGLLTGVQLTGAGLIRATIKGNTAYLNGNSRSSGSSGSGFSDIGYGDTWVGNVAYSNFAYGFIDQTCVYVKHTGDTAFDNNTGNAGNNAGFISQDCLQSSYVNISTDDSRTANYQGYAIYLTSKTNGIYVESNSLCNNTSCGPGQINGGGTNNIVGSNARFTPSPSTNFGTAISNQALFTQGSDNGSVLLKLNLFQVRAGSGCGAGSNTATLNYTFTDPTATIHTNVAGPTLTISANGSVGSYTSAAVSIPIFAGANITWSVSSNLASVGCSTTPQYQASVEVSN